MPRTIPEPGRNCPDPDDLQTGDLLFPRDPDSGTPHAFATTALEAALASRKLDAAIEAYSDTLKEGRERPLVPTRDDRVFDDAPRSKQVFDPNDIGHLLLLVKILQLDFADELKEWLGMTVMEFLKHPLARLLIGAMNKEMGNGFFVGHVGMAFREPGMSGADNRNLFVIEANITDFAHYRVSIHPYFSSDELDLPANSGRMRGWANYRCSMGQMVWARRPAILQSGDETARTIRKQIVEEAKLLLGRPYGFFDSPALGDVDRLYCSEFVLAVFNAVAAQLGAQAKIDVENLRKWKWLLETVGTPEFREQLVADLKKEGKKGSLYDKVIGMDFFLLTVHMLWSSAGLAPLFTPPGQRPYAEP